MSSSAAPYMVLVTGDGIVLEARLANGNIVQIDMSDAGAQAFAAQVDEAVEKRKASSGVFRGLRLSDRF